MNRRGFTLIEMVMVMLALALVAHLAVSDLSRVREARLRRAADEQLERLRESVWSRDALGESRGFLSDMGRMPRAADGTLCELWSMPTNARRYAVLRATAGNLAVPEGDKPALADASVHVPTGWRGPYLRLPVGARRLLDPWGNPVEEVDSAGLRRLWVTNGAVAAVSHYGPKAEARGAATLSLEPDGGARSRLVVTAEIASGGGFSGPVTYKWYGAADGLVTGGVATVAYPAAAVFEGLSPGTKVLKDSVSGVARRIEVAPGDNLVHLRIQGGN